MQPSPSKGAVGRSKHGLQLSQPNLGRIHPGFFVVHMISVAAQTDKHRRRKAILGLAVPALYMRLAGKLTGPNVEFPELCLEGKLRCLKYECNFPSRHTCMYFWKFGSTGLNTF